MKNTVKTEVIEYIPDKSTQDLLDLLSEQQESINKVFYYDISKPTYLQPYSLEGINVIKSEYITSSCHKAKEGLVCQNL